MHLRDFETLEKEIGEDNYVDWIIMHGLTLISTSPANKAAFGQSCNNYGCYCTFSHLLVILVKLENFINLQKQTDNRWVLLTLQTVHNISIMIKHTPTKTAL